MIDQTHKGVGALITNQLRSHYYVQQKDEQYPIEKWRGAYSFWGGALEEDDRTELVGLLRELDEELSWQPDSSPHFIGMFMVESDHVFPISLFEIVLDNSTLQKLAADNKVMEGRGLLVPKNELFANNWVWDLDKVLHQYFELIK